MFSLKYSTRFKKDLKAYKHNKLFLAELNKVLNVLITGKNLDEKYRCHALIGEFKNCIECHIKPEVLLIYKIEKKEISILLLRIGSNSELF